MFFLAVLTWATLTTEAPVILKVFRTLDDCTVEASKRNNPVFPPSDGSVKFICLEARGDA
jgi:hypothetical protein